ncbi:Thiol-disulfide oxidoreductase ResA [Thalassoglobus neptunius]|uniref:Thiol-disulfide oxidoreductase ResA n=1 Tax=Thalassoglobus neptunius TaxID=1938619 RepID=A0A5C5WGC7_9PLAN|nr:redoxin domain-containing protein [Thalassoglobus neptunius]TWT49834.1 Thiol-disulfide oxidoreductase ResA [Thalassoglobus neptunius]
MPSRPLRSPFELQKQSSTAILRGMMVIAVIFSLLSCATAEESSLGKRIDNFSLKDHRGKNYSLDDFNDSKLVLVAFLGTECPLAKLYVHRLNQLKEEFRESDLSIIAVNSNVQDSLSDLSNSIRDQGITFPVLKDATNEVADEFGATRTPEVFVLDQNRIVRYFGRVDDQYVVGITRSAPSREDAKIAIQELLAGEAVSVPETQALGCIIGRRKTPNENSPVTYSNQIARIFQNRCVGCHREGEVAPFSMETYDDVAGWGEMIAEVVQEGRMPPWHANPQYGHFSNDVSLSEKEKQLIATWVANGAPEGDPSELPVPKEYVEGWQLATNPDMVIPMADQPFEVAAEVGPEGIKYQHFWVDPKIDEDRWVTGMEARPGNPLVVHHIIVYVHPQGKNTREHSFLTAYVPGLRLQALPPGAAKLIPAGSWLRFEMHYTPIGTEETDISQVGLVFAEPESIKYEVKTLHVGNTGFELKPYLANQKVTAKSGKSPEEVTLLSMSPHMHLRGQAFRFEAEFPDGSREILLDVPNYDFNWQTQYRLAEPRRLPAGTRLHCTALFDNSENNLANPDPSKTVYWGDQSWDEMMLGYYDIMVSVEPELLTSTGSVESIVKKILSQLDTDQNSRLSLDEAKPLDLLSRNFDRVDQNGDGFVSEDELSAAVTRMHKQ